MSLTGKTKKDTYKDLIQLDNSNSGIPVSDSANTNLVTLKDGLGQSSLLSIGQDRSKIQPQYDNTEVFNVNDKDANSLFNVDSTNNAVKALGVNVNTNYAYFANSSIGTAQFTANEHFAILFGGSYRSNYSSSQRISLGTSTNPATTYENTATADEIVGRFWFVPDNIIIDKVSVWVGASNSSGDTLRFHLMAYDIVTASGSTGGNLSNGVVIADGSDISNDGNEQAYFQDMTIQSSSVTANQAVLFTFLQTGTNSDYSVSATIKYHCV